MGQYSSLLDKAENDIVLLADDLVIEKTQHLKTKQKFMNIIEEKDKEINTIRNELKNIMLIKEEKSNSEHDELEKITQELEKANDEVKKVTDAFQSAKKIIEQLNDDLKESMNENVMLTMFKHTHLGMIKRLEEEKEEISSDIIKLKLYTELNKLFMTRVRTDLESLYNDTNSTRLGKLMKKNCI